MCLRSIYCFVRNTSNLGFWMHYPPHTLPKIAATFQQETIENR